MKYKNFSYSDHIEKEHHVTAHKKKFSGNTGIHFHEFFEIELAVSGKGSCMINGTEYSVEKGVGYILTPADFHYLNGKEDLQLYNIMFDESVVSKELLVRIFENENSRCFYFSDDELLQISNLIKMLIKERYGSEKYNNAAISNLLELIVIYILRKIESGECEDSNTAAINSALRYVYTHLRENPPIKKLAQLCNYTPNYFSKLFGELTGKKYPDFLNDLKISTAKHLLASSNFSVKEIAMECGYSSVSNFYRVFKIKVGESPLSYKRSKNKNEK